MANMLMEVNGFVRKCMGKNKQVDCLQLSDHPNTRWECAFETQSKDDYLKHCKNISKRLKWRELVDNNKPDKEGWLRCVYFSTDKHHVENHFHKGSNDGAVSLAPSPQNVRYKTYFITAPQRPSTHLVQMEENGNLRT